MVPATENPRKDIIHAVSQATHRRPDVALAEGRQIPDIMKNGVHATVRHLAHESMLTGS